MRLYQTKHEVDNRNDAENSPKEIEQIVPQQQLVQRYLAPFPGSYSGRLQGLVQSKPEENSFIRGR